MVSDEGPWNSSRFQATTLASRMHSYPKASSNQNMAAVPAVLGSASLTLWFRYVIALKVPTVNAL